VPRAPSVALALPIGQAPALPFAYPVVVKALSAEIAHKSDVGGVALNVGDGAALLAAIERIQNATKAGRVLVQPMIAGLGEVLIGYRVDADVGPLVMLAAGGILAEIHRDRSLRLAPVDLPEAKAMIGEVAALKALAGYRGHPPGDLDAVAQAVVALSRLAVTDGPAVAEAEVNPLIVLPQGQGVVAVDALVKLM
jgi:succinyl-CoA synthetase beta subunit